ncbi:glycosyltransferase family 4 protein [Patescibacteria group bacterium]|nr:glycosyltransferase family 4 protein [Patescibacteria group bacterium]MBU1963445.1 glycosyltransferase family 4 protein [Patescibacteria group bacterium]
MKIGIDLRSVDNSFGGGIANYAASLCDNLQKIDQKNQYIFFNSGLGKDYNIPNKVLNTSLRFFNYPKLDKKIGGVDIFFSPNILFQSLSPDCKHVICCHDLSFLLFPEFLSMKRRIWHHLVQAKKLYQEADKIIAVSKNTKQDLINELNIPEEKIKVIYSGINPASDIDPEDIKKIKNKHNISDNFIFTLSVIEPRKNIESLIQVYNKIDPEADLVVAGRKGWKSQIIKTDKIKVLENISEKEKQALYQACQVFVFPSFYEGFGFPPLEAMAAGAPVIASANSSLSEICADKALLIDPYNLEEIEIALKEMLKDNSQYKNMNLNKEFNWEKTARETLELFESLV